jgi:predicted methyltransferase
MTGMMVLSHFQTRQLLMGRDAGARHAPASTDLGLTRVEALIEPQGVCFPGGERISWDAIKEINTSENSCFLVEEGEPHKIQRFSDFTNQLFSLMPTQRAPTMLISGVPMHRIKDTDPYHDTLEKIKVLKPVVGRVLDTATGLGYTAIEAAKTADQVVTIELDPTALEIARCNPWSQALFENSRIEQRLGDSFEVVATFDRETFSRVIHDPPAFRLAGHLYSREFYAELYRVLRRGGRLFHYVGDPESRSGRSVTRGVLRRLQEVGFKRVQRRPRAFGVLAFK